MNRRSLTWVFALALVILWAGCREAAPVPGADVAPADEPGAVSPLVHPVADNPSPTMVYDDSGAEFTKSSTGGDSLTFQALITPTNATPPVTYQWSPEPASGQGTASATYQWGEGVHDIVVSATNCGGTVAATRTITIGRSSPGRQRFWTDPSISEIAAQQRVVFQDGVSPDVSYAGTRDLILANDVASNVNLGGVDYVETFFGAGEEHRRSLIRWDLSALPADITIGGASVELFPIAGPAENDMSIALHRVTREWTEGTGDDFFPDPSYIPDGATWLTATTGVAWTTPGGDYDATLLDQLTLPTGMEDVWLRLDATAAVRAWVEDGQPNYGLLLRPLSGDYTYYHYHSREATALDFRPRLVITYTGGVPPTQPQLTLTAPTGSTRWPISSTQQIRWNTTGTVTYVNLHYSLDNFATVHNIASTLDNTGAYAWTTPTTPTTSARVRVESVVSPTTIYDVSDAFTLYETGTITVHLPLVVRNYAPEPSCPYPLTGVAISGPSAPPSGDLVQPSDLIYQGAFRLPDDADRPRTFEYGGDAMTFNPSGDPSGPGDGFPGSLFLTGHDRLAYGELPDGSQVAEISIPVPVVASNLDDLSQAGFLQGFHDVAAGFFTGLDEIPRIGMEYLDTPATGPKIYLAWGQHFHDNVTTTIASHAWFDPNLASPDFQGTWFIGNQSLYSVNGYMFAIPTSWADENAAGRYLATGRFRDGGWSGMGPALFAYRPWIDESGTPAPSGAHLEETVLLLYQSSETTSNIERCLDSYQHPDEWEGGAWITTGTGKTAVLFAGTKGTGAKYWYGFVNPAGPEYPCVEEELVGQFTLCRLADGTPCPAEDLTECEGHNDYRGWWSARFDAQFILYNPADLAQVAAGELPSWEPQPYVSLDLDEYLFHNPAGIEGDILGTGVQRRQRIGAVAYDRSNDLLYVLELFADGAKPVVHVWKVE